MREESKISMSFKSFDQKVFWVIALLIIFIFNLVVFYPSFSHPARADQLIYFIDTVNVKDFPDLFFYSYSWPRIRLVNTGDSFLFRPLVYLLIALEKFLFGLNPFYWQITGLFLHLILLVQLARILFLIRPDPVSLLFVLNFSVFYISEEMVIWYHVNGYILFLIFLLAAFYYSFKYVSNNSIQGDKQESRCLMLIVTYLTLACFTYEFGIICCVFLMVFITLKQRIQRENLKKNLKVLSLLIPILIYFYINYVDYKFFQIYKSFHSIIGNFGIVSGIGFDKYFFTIIRDCLLGWMPYLIQIFPAERLSLAGWDWKSISSASANFCGVVFNLILIVLLAWVLTVFFVTRITRRKNIPSENKDQPGMISPVRHMGYLSAALFISYILITVVRSAMHPMSGYYLMISIYYLYISNLFLIITGYCLYVIYVTDRNSGKRLAEILVILILTLSCVLNGIKTYQMNNFLKKEWGPWNLYMSRIESFVKSHKLEKNFSFDFVWRQRIRPITFYIGDPSKGKEIRSEFLDFIFQKYMRTDHPKYHLLYFDGKGILAFKDKEAAYRFLQQKKELERKQYVFDEDSFHELYRNLIFCDRAGLCQF